MPKSDPRASFLPTERRDAMIREGRMDEVGALHDRLRRVLRDNSDVHFPGQRIVLIMDNLNTHRLSTLYETFVPEEAMRIAGRFEIYYTPKHGSWLNVAEVKTNVLRSQSLDRRITDRETLCREVVAWQRDRNRSAKPFDWRFRTEDARIKLKSL